MLIKHHCFWSTILALQNYFVQICKLLKFWCITNKSSKCTVEMKVLNEKPTCTSWNTHSQKHKFRHTLTCLNNEFGALITGEERYIHGATLDICRVLIHNGVQLRMAHCKIHVRNATRLVRNVQNSWMHILSSQNDASKLWLISLLHNKLGLSFLSSSTLFHSTTKRLQSPVHG